MDSLLNFIRDPNRISVVCGVYIVSYYLVSYFSIKNINNRRSKWRRDGPLDRFTSITWIGFAIVLIWGLGSSAFSDTVTLRDLIKYYFLFIFLFAFCYGILDWHWPGMLKDLSDNPWKRLVEHVLLSIQTQTTIGYIRGKPNRFVSEIVTCVQALLGIFLITISIARAVNKMY